MTTGAPGGRPPAWFMLATAALAVVLLLMAVTETSLLGHYLIDQGEFIALIGLGFVAVAGVVLYRSGRLHASMPFVLPWLVYPVVTQGDQVIDNLTINWMRLLTHILLALIFAAPALVVAFSAKQVAASPGGRKAFLSPVLGWIPGLRPLAEGRTREGVGLLAAFLFAVEFLAAHLTLGLIMIVTLVVMTGIALVYASRPEAAPSAGQARTDYERRAAVLLAVGLVVSAGLYVGYKNRPGAYQGSPSYLLDPAQQAAGYDIDATVVPAGAPAPLDETSAAALTAQLSTYGRALEQLVDGYYVAERNYTYDFHNALFVRSWPVLPNYRQVALNKIAEARATAAQADAMLVTRRDGDALQAWVDEVRAYVAFNFARATVLERLTGEFERTQAGLQHAAHIYEGEGKLVGLGLRAIEDKHAPLLQAPVATPVVAPFLAQSRAVYERYANRIVGF